MAINNNTSAANMYDFTATVSGTTNYFDETITITDKAHRYLEMLENYDRLLNTLHERNE